MNFDFARRQMVEQQIRAWEVSDPRVLEVLSELPREEFVPAGYERLAFAETSIPLPHGQRMLTPMLEGRLLHSLRLTPDDDVLEIGTGSGFLTACLARLSARVTSVDIFADFIEAADARLREQGSGNATLLRMDAMQALPEGRFDAIAVGGSMPIFDRRLFEVLRPGGRLFVVVGTGPAMSAQLIERPADPRTDARPEALPDERSNERPGARPDERPNVTSLFETNVPPLLNAPAPPSFTF